MNILDSWDRGPERFRLAVTMAREWQHDPVALNVLAMQYTLATDKLANTESLETQLKQLVGLGMQNAISAREQIAKLLVNHKRTMPWHSFQSAAAAIPLAEAERMVKERSYTIFKPR
jgi:hypothetical protein